MIEENSRTNGEFYENAPVYSWAIRDGKKYVVGMVDKIYSLGTPEHLEEYLSGQHKYIVNNGCGCLWWLYDPYDWEEISRKRL